MGTETEVPMTPRGALLSSFIGIIAGIISGGLLASPSLFTLRGEPLLFSFGILGLFTLLVFQTQAILSREGELKREPSALQWAIGIASTFIHFNAVVWISVFIGAFANDLTGLAIAGIPLVIAYAFWDMITQKRAAPLSAGGLVVFTLALGFVVYQAGSRVREWLSDVDLKVAWQALKFATPSALDVLETPERESARLFIRPLRRLQSR